MDLYQPSGVGRRRRRRSPESRRVGRESDRRGDGVGVAMFMREAGQVTIASFLLWLRTELSYRNERSDSVSR